MSKKRPIPKKPFKDNETYKKYLYKLTPEQLDDFILVLRGEIMFSEFYSYQKECQKTMLHQALIRRGDIQQSAFSTVDVIEPLPTQLPLKLVKCLPCHQAGMLDVILGQPNKVEQLLLFDKENENDR